VRVGFANLVPQRKKSTRGVRRKGEEREKVGSSVVPGCREVNDGR